MFLEHADLISATACHAFVAALIDGSLPLVNFVTYLRDEVALLQAYSRAFARLGSAFAPAACQHGSMTDLLLRVNTIQELLAREIQHRLELTGRLAADSEERLSLPPPTLSVIRAAMLAGSMVESSVGTLSPARACAFLAASVRVLTYIGHQGLACMSSLSSACALGDTGLSSPCLPRYKPWLARCAGLAGGGAGGMSTAPALTQVVENLLELLASVESLPKNDLHPWYAQSLRLHMSIFTQCAPPQHSPAVALRPGWVGIDFDETLTSVDTTAVYAPLAAASASSEEKGRQVGIAWEGLAREYMHEYKGAWEGMIQAHGLGYGSSPPKAGASGSPGHEQEAVKPIRSPLPRAASPGKEVVGRVSQATASSSSDIGSDSPQAPAPSHPNTSTASAHSLPQARGLMRIQEPHRPSALAEEGGGTQSPAPTRRSSALLPSSLLDSSGRGTCMGTSLRPYSAQALMAFMTDWCAWEGKMADKVSARALLRGIRREQLVSAGKAGKGPFRPFAAHVLRALTGAVPSIPGPHPTCAILSVNWSSTFVRACLGHALSQHGGGGGASADAEGRIASGSSTSSSSAPDYALAVYAGELAMGPGEEGLGEPPVSTGALGGSMSTGLDKLRAMRAVVTASTLSVYIGDGVADVLPLLCAHVGVIIDRGKAKEGVLARAGAPVGRGETVPIEYDSEPGSPQAAAGRRGALLQLCSLFSIPVLPLLALKTQAGRDMLAARVQHSQQRGTSLDVEDPLHAPRGHEPASRPLLFWASGWDEIMACLPGYGGDALLEATKPLLSAAEIGAAMAAKMMA